LEQAEHFSALVNTVSTSFFNHQHPLLCSFSALATPTFNIYSSTWLVYHSVSTFHNRADYLCLMYFTISAEACAPLGTL
jgi:hypothetical protein